ncbi:tyrosine-type recombinase/integrase [Pseudomonadota bacterium]
MASKIDTKPKRDRLAVRREPYWAKVQKGAYIGYRRTGNGGTWIARYRDDSGKQKYQSLTLPPHLICNVYDAAVTEARTWFQSLEAGVQPRSGTVAEATEDYIEELRVRKGERAANDAKSRVDRHINPVFGKKKLPKVTTKEIERWLNAFIPEQGKPEQIRKAKATANRNLSSLKAILNRAHRNGLLGSSLAWSRVKPFSGVDSAREDFLAREQVTALIEASAGGFQKLVKAGALTGARYGELRALRVHDLDREAKVLHIREGKTGKRIVPLTDDVLNFFVEQTRDKLSDAYLLTRDDARPWQHSDQDKLMRQAVKKAKLPPSVVFYTLRHSYIATAIVAGLDIYSVAKITGTSVRMIEKYYGKLLQGQVRDALTRAEVIPIEKEAACQS